MQPPVAPSVARCDHSAMKEEVNSSNWKEFCQRLSDLERGQLVTVDLVEHNGEKRRAGSALAVENIEFQTLNGCNDGIVIRAQDGFQHTVISPIRILLVRNASGGFNPVEIDAEAGSTILTFKPALNPTVLDGLQVPAGRTA